MTLLSPPPASPRAALTEEPLRERKERRTRQHIIDCAAALFEEHGFERVTVADVARAAEVGEQTVYNYFSTKEGLVFDEADAFADRFAAMARDRSAGCSLMVAVRREVHLFLDDLARRPAHPHRRGGMPYLVATSAIVRRGWLALMERHSGIVAEALIARSGGSLPAAAAGVVGWAIVAIFAVIVDAVGETVRDDGDVEVLIRRLRPEIDAAVDLLGRGLGEGDSLAWQIGS